MAITYERKDENKFFSEAFENGKTIRATAYTLVSTDDQKEVNNFNETELVEIKTTRNEYDKATKKTEVKTSFVSVAPSVFRELAESYLAL